MIDEKVGKYTIVEIVGIGNIGTVYKAEDPEGRLVAIKHVRSHILCSMEKRELFLQCALAASEIRHKGICPIIEIADENDDFYIITPFVTGKTLDKYMVKKNLPWLRSLDIVLEAGEALAAIHATGVAHRGLKPANIWILNDPPLSVLLSDCCIARFTEIADREKVRSSGFEVDSADSLIPLGALSYMSPEQVRGDPIDCRTDIFSLGVVLYELLSGRHPFETRDSIACISSILEAEPSPFAAKHASTPFGLDSIIYKALAKKPAMRYQNIKEMLADLQSVRDKSFFRKIPGAKNSFGIRRWLANIRRFPRY
jgi:eukaryotic-like serine/threonine-protein kinase